jgi:hypothetical protein
MSDSAAYWRLWCQVYDGPLSWEGRDAFEQIAYLESQLRQFQSLPLAKSDTSVPKAP